MDIMLSENFKEEYITGIKEQIASMASAYRFLFNESSSKLEKGQFSMKFTFSMKLPFYRMILSKIKDTTT